MVPLYHLKLIDSIFVTIFIRIILVLIIFFEVVILTMVSIVGLSLLVLHMVPVPFLGPLVPLYHLSYTPIIVIIFINQVVYVILFVVVPLVVVSIAVHSILIIVIILVIHAGVLVPLYHLKTLLL